MLVCRRCVDRMSATKELTHVPLVQATRDDELSVAASETIIVAGEYKNPGWVWASRINSSGQAAGGYRLCPANYLLFIQPPGHDAQPPVADAGSQLPVSMQHQHYQQLPASASTSSTSNLTSCPKPTVAPNGLGAAGRDRESYPSMGSERLVKSSSGALPIQSLPSRAPATASGSNCLPALVSLCLRAPVHDWRTRACKLLLYDSS